MSRKPGPEPKGERGQITVRLPRTHVDRYRIEAAASGMSLSDYLTLKLAQAHSLDTPPYLQVSREQPGLPIAS